MECIYEIINQKSLKANPLTISAWYLNIDLEEVLIRLSSVFEKRICVFGNTRILSHFFREMDFEHLDFQECLRIIRLSTREWEDKKNLKIFTSPSPQNETFTLEKRILCLGELMKTTIICNTDQLDPTTIVEPLDARATPGKILSRLEQDFPGLCHYKTGNTLKIYRKIFTPLH